MRLPKNGARVKILSCELVFLVVSLLREISPREKYEVTSVSNRVRAGVPEIVFSGNLGVPCC